MSIYSILSIIVILATIAMLFIRRYEATLVLILGNLMVYFLTVLSAQGISLGRGLAPVVGDLGFRPVYLETGESLYTIITQMFVHGGIEHILFNMLFLFLIGTQLEARIGKRRFVVIYLLSGLLAVLVETVLRLGDTIVIIGASGAISGIMGAMLFLYPRDEIPFFLGPIFLPRVKVWLSVGLWFLLQVFLVFSYSDGGVAYGAHVGGAVAGIVIAEVTASMSPVALPRRFDPSALRPYATTPELKRALEQIEASEEEDVRRVWLEYFAERMECPDCGGRASLRGNKLKCPCGFEVELR